MGLNNPDRLVNAGIPAETTLAIQDQVTGLGNLATQPSGGGTSMTTTGNIFEFFNQTGVGNGADTTEDTLKSFTLPANALDAAGRGVFIYAWGKYSADLNTKTAKLYFGASSVSAQTAAAAGNTAWALEMVVGKAAANQQVISAQSIVGTAHGGVTNSTAGVDTDTAGIVIKLTGQDSTSAAANRIVLNGMYIQFMN